MSSKFSLEIATDVYLVICEETSCSCFFPCFPPSVRRSVKTMIAVVGQRKRLSIHGHTHYQLLPFGSQFDPVVDSEVLGKNIDVKSKLRLPQTHYRVEGGVYVFRVVVHGSHVTGDFIPLSVVVVTHDRYPVQVLGQHGDVVTSIDDSFTGGHRGGEQPSSRFELFVQFLNQCRKRWFVRSRAFVTIDLNRRRINFQFA